jgi:transposase
MVSAVRKGASIQQVATRFRVARSTVRFWLRRAGDRRLDRVDWAGRSSGPRQPANKTASELEDLVLALRKELKQTSALGEFGAAAIRRELQQRGCVLLPSVRTIGRILQRRGALDGVRRIRRKAPPRGWYLPDLAARQAELDSFDIVEGLVIQGGLGVEVLNGISVHGGLPVSWPKASITAKIVVNAILGHWRQFGLPDYAQFDNDTVFQGPHQHPDTVGRVIRLCLSLGVVPVFAPPRETGFQAAIENFNGRWQAKVWSRFTHESRKDLQSRSDRFITASRRRAAERIDNAPARHPFPENWKPDLQAAPRGRIVYIRGTNDCGQATVLGHSLHVDDHWTHRLVRAEVQLDLECIRFYALRRRQPEHQPLLREIPYQFPKRKFHE